MIHIVFTSIFNQGFNTDKARMLHFYKIICLKCNINSYFSVN